MPTIRIPIDHREIVATLSHLSTDEVAALNTALLDAHSDIAATRAALSPYVKSPALALEALVGMANTITGHGLGAHAVSQAVMETLGDDGGSADLTPLLENEAIRRIAKHFDVGYSHERLVSNTRIFTEMRPIFDDPVESSFKAAVITHSLQITSYESGDPHELFFTLDREDLKQMIDQVQRALNKEASLHKMLEAAGVTPMVQPDGETA